MSAIPLTARSVLIVEDGRETAESLGRCLEGGGYDVDVALDGVTGFRLAQSEAYDAIVLDATLPGMDGLDVYRQLRADKGFASPILILVESERVQEVLGRLNGNTDRYMLSPFRMAAVLSEVDQLTFASVAHRPALQGLETRETGSIQPTVRFRQTPSRAPATRITSKDLGRIA